jgi:hypothetical protein
VARPHQKARRIQKAYVRQRIRLENDLAWLMEACRGMRSCVFWHVQEHLESAGVVGSDGGYTHQSARRMPKSTYVDSAFCSERRSRLAGDALGMRDSRRCVLFKRAFESAGVVGSDWKWLEPPPAQGECPKKKRTYRTAHSAQNDDPQLAAEARRGMR